MPPWTVAHQGPLSLGFSRQEYWRGVPCPPAGYKCKLLEPLQPLNLCPGQDGGPSWTHTHPSLGAGPSCPFWNGRQELPWWQSGKEATCSEGDAGSIPGSERFPGEGNGNPLHYSCLGNPIDRGTWRVIVHEVTKESDMT